MPSRTGTPPKGEFVRHVDMEELADGASRDVALTATADERARLARRFGLLGLDRFEARATLSRQGAAVRAAIDIEADVVQACVVTLEPIAATVSDSVVVTFRPMTPGDATEVDIDVRDEDPPEPLVGHAVDLGEPAAEALGLALDPYPRKPDAAFGGWSDAEAPAREGPFTVLSRLKR